MPDYHPTSRIKIKHVEGKPLTGIEFAILYVEVRLPDLATQAAEELQELRQALNEAYQLIAQKVDEREVATTQDKTIISKIERLLGE